LNALVDEFVLTTLPVSSSVLAERYLPGVSSATIRNELLGLETAGLAFAPHTSAGRIPTNQGYRYFVNHLLLRPLSLMQTSSIVEVEPFGETGQSPAAGQLAPMTGHARVRQVLESLSLSTGLLALFWDREANLGLVVRGLSRLIAQPEFSDSTRLLPLMTLIEEQDALIRMLEGGLSAADLSVSIGLEAFGILAGYTLLARRCVGQTAVIGLLGPTRMEYRRALSALDSVARLNMGLNRM
jgi:heat-inducible transcriptional repressor